MSVDNLALEVKACALSIIIPVYNADNYLGRTLDSILAQSFQDYEIILIDDCSTDGSGHIMESYRTDRIECLYSEKNTGGPSAPRNRGVTKAKGKYILFFDSDDVMLPGKLDAIFDALESNPDIGLVCTNFQSINEAGNLLNDNYLREYTRFRTKFIQVDDGAFRLNKRDAYAELLNANFVGTSSVAIPRKVFVELGGFNTTLTNSEDYHLWLRISDKYDFVFLDNPYHQYRIHQDSISFRGGESAKNRIRVLSSHLERDLLSGEMKSVRRRLAENHFSAGLFEYGRGEVLLARGHFHCALKYGRDWKSLKHYITSFFPKSIVIKIHDLVK